MTFRIPPRLSALLPRALYEFAFGVVTLTSAAPLVAARHLPLQDLPQHMAAIAVLRRLPFEHGLAEYFTATLSRTQYLLVYVLGVVLSLPFGVENATRILAALTVCSLPYALRYTLRKTGGDPRLAALAWPLAWNPQMMLGFLNFLLGVPIALVGIGLFADADARHRPRRQLVLAALALAAFYAHLIPYGMLGLGVLLLLPFNTSRALEATASLTERLHALRDDLGEALRQTVFLVPSLAAVLVWLLRTPATEASVRAGGIGVTPHPEWPSLASLPRELSSTLLDFPGDRDERALILWGLAALAAIALGRRIASPRAAAPEQSPARLGLALGIPLGAVLAFLVIHRAHVGFASLWSADYVLEASWAQMAWHALLVWTVASFLGLVFVTHVSPPTEVTEDTHRMGARLAWLPVVCALLYVCAPTSYGWIWPIHTRFAVAAALTLPLLIGTLRPSRAGLVITAILAVASMGLSMDVADRFARWEANDLGDLDAALDHALPGKRLIALIPAQASGLVPNVPLLHSAAYYQIRGGDVATFSFADFPQSPFRYREDGPRPPRLPPRWEWTSDLRVADPQGTYYDYVLARAGAFDAALRASGRYVEVYRGALWSLWSRAGR